MKNPNALYRSFLGNNKQEGRGEGRQVKEVGEGEEESIKRGSRERKKRREGKRKKSILLFKSLLRDGNTQIVSLNKGTFLG